MINIICFGEILWDCFPSDRKAGGAPMNVAFHLHKQGCHSLMISSVGNDDDGKKLVRFLQQRGLETQYVQVNKDLPTGIVEVHLDGKSNATYTIVKPVAWDAIKHSEELDQLISGSDALVFGSLACRTETSKSTLLELLKHAKLKIFDMNLRPPHYKQETLEELMHHSTVLKLNEDEFEYLNRIYDLDGSAHKQQLSSLSRKFGLQTICVTLGNKGAMTWHKNKLSVHPGFKVKVADTVGSGDAFLAAFIKGLLRNSPMPEILENACATGALIASLPGANPDYVYEDILKIKPIHGLSL